MLETLAGLEVNGYTDKIISEADEKSDMEYLMHWYNHERKIVTNDNKAANKAVNDAATSANEAVNDAATSANEAVNKAVQPAPSA